MPSDLVLDYSPLREEARRQVRAKFPGLIEGSSGWTRAVTNRFNRLRMQK
jgi:hypothetical protein